MTHRPRKSRAPKGHLRPETLAQFSAKLDAHFGEPVGFADAVTQLYITRRKAAHLKAARKPFHEQCKGGYALGHRVIPGTGYQIKQRSPGEPTTYKAVESATAKAANKQAWLRAHIEVPYVQVSPPAAVAEALRGEIEVAVPSIGSCRTLAQAAVTYKEHPAWEQLAQLRLAEAELIDTLDKIGANAGWDGGVDEPEVFADGWVVRLRRTQFNSDRLAEVAPDVFNQLAVTKVRQSPGAIVITPVDEDDDDDGAVDLDGD
jgi:hypothetical protein